MKNKKKIKKNHVVRPFLKKLKIKSKRCVMKNGPAYSLVFFIIIINVETFL